MGKHLHFGKGQIFCSPGHPLGHKAVPHTPRMLFCPAVFVQLSRSEEQKIPTQLTYHSERNSKLAANSINLCPALK